MTLFRTILILLMTTTIVNAETIGELQYKYSNSYEVLVEWTKSNLVYSYANESIKLPVKRFIEVGEGDCEEFAYFYKEVLDAGTKYQPVVVALFRGVDFPSGHFVCAIKDYGEVVLLLNCANNKTGKNINPAIKLTLLNLPIIYLLYSNIRFNPKAVKLKFTKKGFFNFLSKKFASPPVIITFKFL